MKYIYLALITVLFLILGFLAFSPVQDLLAAYLKNYNLIYSHMETQLYHTAEFSLICGILPIAVSFIWNKTNVKKSKIKIISVLLLLVAALAFTTIRYSLLKVMLDSQKAFGSSSLVTIESLNFPLTLFIGEFLGFFLMFLFLKKTNKNSLQR